MIKLQVKPRSHCPGFQSRRRYGVDTRAHPDCTVATPTSTALNRDTPGSGPGDFIFFKQPGLTGTHRGAQHHRLIPGYHRSSSGMNRISTVRLSDDTVANRHELCTRWRYGDSRLGHGVSRTRAGVAPVPAGRTTVWHGGSR